MNIKCNLTETIGRTPLVAVRRLGKELNLQAEIVAKLEYFNPGGSVKDRAALSMIIDAERQGVLKPGALIVEPTSGNTGVGLAWIASVKGYQVILTMPETMSKERRNLLKALGAQLELTPGTEGMAGAIRRAEEIRNLTPNAIILQQFSNPANPSAHEQTTAEEIWEDTDGQTDLFVATVGTSETFSGTARRLKQLNPKLYAVAVEPQRSPVLSGGKAGAHRIQGIGAGFIPANYDTTLVDEIIQVSDDDAIHTARLLAHKEGILTGFSSGAAMFAAIKLAQRPENKRTRIVVILPDTGERYLSTDLYAFDTYPLRENTALES